MAKNKILSVKKPGWLLYAAVVVAVVGALLVGYAALGRADGPTGWVPMRVIGVDYDWGVSKPGGRDAEYRHRMALYNELWALIHTQPGERGQRRISVNVPQSWSFEVKGFLGTRSYDVKYEELSVTSKFVADADDCWQGNSGYHLETVEISDNVFETYTLAYKCMAVKLKGNISGGGPLPDFDTHPQVFFVSSIPLRLGNFIHGYDEIAYTKYPAPAVANVGQTGLQRRFSVTLRDEDEIFTVTDVRYVPYEPTATLQDCVGGLRPRITTTEEARSGATRAAQRRGFINPSTDRGGGLYLAEIESDFPSLCVYVYYEYLNLRYWAYYYLPANED